MKVLAINGSPRIGGNSDILLDNVLEGARSRGAKAEKVILAKLKFSPCPECEDTKDDGTCIVKDDMQGLFQKIKKADILILASPIFFGSITAQTKMMIDRFQCVWRAKYIFKKATGYKKKKGVFISVQASNRKDFFNNAKSIVKNLFSMVNAEYGAELFCPNIDEKGAILAHPAYLKKAFELGVKIVLARPAKL